MPKVYKGFHSPVVIPVTTEVGLMYTADQIAAITLVLLKLTIDGTIYWIDSTEHPTRFNFSKRAAYGQIIADLGFFNLPVGRDPRMEVIVYDPDFTAGRVVIQLAIEVSDEAFITGTSLTEVTQAGVFTETSIDYTMLESNVNGGIRLNSAVDRTITGYSFTASHNNTTVRLQNLGAGSLIFEAPLGYSIGTSGHTTLTISSVMAAVTLMYIHSIQTFIVIDSSGSWESS